MLRNQREQAVIESRENGDKGGPSTGTVASIDGSTGGSGRTAAWLPLLPPFSLADATNQLYPMGTGSLHEDLSWVTSSWRGTPCQSEHRD